MLSLNGCLSNSESEGAPRLAWEDIDPSDVNQGWLGNCWLVASISALAEFPSAVQDLFVEMDVAKGRYVVKLYDMVNARWEHVTIDDFIPCVYEDDWSEIPCKIEREGGTVRKVYAHDDIYNGSGLRKVPGRWLPLFARPRGTKVWALLLEKAMAKFVGGYAMLAGGSEPYALMAFTGFPLVYCFVRPSCNDDDTSAHTGVWERHGAQYISRDVTGQTYVRCSHDERSLVDREMWAKLVDYGARNYLMTCSIAKFDEAAFAERGHLREDGLVVAHAYALVRCVTTTRRDGEVVRLVLLRNPHGENPDGPTLVAALQQASQPVAEWGGAWGNFSAEWRTHPEVARQVGYRPRSDGSFWISFEDFASIFDKVCVLAKSSGKPSFAPDFSTPEDGGLCLGLEMMAKSNAGMDQAIRQTSQTFDPFANMPAFLEDGSIETRLRWEATKPGRLREFLDLNRTVGNELSYDALRRKVIELGLEGALCPRGQVSNRFAHGGT
jgi:calpain-15